MIYILTLLLMTSFTIIFFLRSINNSSFEKIVCLNILSFIVLIIFNFVILNTNVIILLVIITSIQTFWLSVLSFNKEGIND